jgi:hypothetical protein
MVDFGTPVTEASSFIFSPEVGRVDWGWVGRFGISRPSERSWLVLLHAFIKIE